MKDKSPEDMKKVKEAWFAWKDQCGDTLLDFGQPVGPSICLTQSGSQPSQRQLCGYHIIQAEDMEAAKKVVENHPHLQDPTAELEVNELMPLPNQ